MDRWRRAFSLALAFFGGSLGGACTSGLPEPEGACVDYAELVVENCGGESCRFEADILPLLSQRCADGAGACHSPDTILSQGLVLAPAPGQELEPSEVEAVYFGLFEEATLAELPIVAPRDPGASFLLAKVEYDFLDGEAACALPCGEAGCGARMPQGGQILSAAEIDRLRSWVASGAGF